MVPPKNSGITFKKEACMKVKLLSEVQQYCPAFTPRWQRSMGDVLAEDLRFGSLRHGVVCADDGSPEYDLPVWLEPLGAVCVTVTVDGRIALLEHFRPVPRGADAQVPWPPTDLSTCGRVSWELPRGFPNQGETADQAARREAEEELGWLVESVEPLGESNANTTFCWNTPEVFLVRVNPSRRATGEPDKLEKIRRVELFSWTEVLQMTLDGSIFCGFTKSALFSYYARHLSR
jgi:8-oxo-dGTP pyrophosphatase MutT (NUDIX family)